MPEFNLKGIKAAKYINTSGVISYDTPVSCGGAMTANLELRFAEGRLYAEGTLAEYIRKATGGTLSLGVKYLPNDAQKLLFGVTDKTRGTGTSATTSLLTSAKDKGFEVGVVFYCDDMIDGVQKETCVFIRRSRFGQPSMQLQTMGENIQFATPTTSGEFLPDHSTEQGIMEVFVADDETKAAAWCNAVLGVNA